MVLDADICKNEALRKELSTLLDRAVSSGIFTQKERDMFIPDCLIMPVFHHFPKIHKGLDPLFGRPIIAGIGTLSERLGQWVDDQLQPLGSDLP